MSVLNETVQISNRLVGKGSRTFIIAEAGSNHNKSNKLAIELIDAASDAGCDAIKFQLFYAERLYQKKSHIIPILKKNELPREWVPELVEHCNKKNILFTASPFDTEAVDLLCDNGAPLIKIASPEIHDIPLLRYSAKKNVPIIVSTGMATMVDIYHAISTIKNEGNNDIIILQCKSLYPASPENINLNMMGSIKSAFGTVVGLSDHSQSVHIPSAAVALGASVIEKHFSISRNLAGPDHSYALEPDELKSMVEGIRETENALGQVMKNPLYGVEDVLLNNKSLVSKCTIKKGVVITEGMLTVKRAKTGIKPINIEMIIGRKTLVDIPEDSVLEWVMI